MPRAVSCTGHMAAMHTSDKDNDATQDDAHEERHGAPVEEDARIRGNVLCALLVGAALARDQQAMRVDAQRRTSHERAEVTALLQQLVGAKSVSHAAAALSCDAPWSACAWIASVPAPVATSTEGLYAACAWLTLPWANPYEAC